MAAGAVAATVAAITAIAAFRSGRVGIAGPRTLDDSDHPNISLSASAWCRPSRGPVRGPWYFSDVNLRSLRGSALGLVLGCAAWSAGCATPQPMMDPVFASGTYAPARVALLPPDVFVVLDQVGDNDAVASAALGQA